MTPWVRRLIFANIAVFLVQMSVPGITRMLAFVPAFILQRPWTLLTYMFTHSTAGISHIAFNMFALFIFGPRVEQRLGGTQFVRMYLIAGISGGLLSLFFTPYAAIVGASGAVFGVQLAFAMFYPTERLMIWGIIPIQARVLVIIMTLITLYGGFSGGSGVAHFAHLGGYVGAYIYLKWVERQAPSRKWQDKLAGPPPSKVAVGNWKGVDLNRVHEVNRDEVARILGKIAQQGEGSLTSQERVFLGHFTPKEA
jgi:membrane associated rhomboid family serine protease